MMVNGAERILLHSGGAVGADYEWAKAALASDPRYFIEMHSFYGHDCKTDELDHSRIHRRVHSFESMQKEALPHICNAAAALGKFVPKKPYVLNLQLRDYYQIVRSEYVFAVSTITPDRQHVDGGTGWAVECAKAMGIPVLVFDQARDWWFSFSYAHGAFVPCKGAPPAGFIRSLGNEHITGIGTRKISQSGIEAIRGVV